MGENPMPNSGSIAGQNGSITDAAILIVHPDPGVLSEISELTSSLGYECLTAVNGVAALEAVQGQVVDLVISDLDLPDMGGLEVLDHLKKRSAEVAFIALTGFDDGLSWEDILRAGANDFIKKPFTGREFQTTIKRTLIQHRLEMENLALLRTQAALNDRLTHMLAISSDLTAELDVERLFPLIIGQVTEALGAERTSLYVIDWEEKELWTKVAEQVGEIRVPLGQGISGRVAVSGEVINVPDAWELPYFNREFDKRHDFRTRSVLCMAIRNQAGERIGVIQVMNKQGGGEFSDDDVYFLRGLAGQIGISLDNSLLHEELRLSFESSIRTLSAVVDARHPLTAGHSQRVTEYSLMIARQMGVQGRELEVLKYAALLHDIGKIGVRDDVLLKSGPFDDEERREMNMHPVKTKVILENFRFPRNLKDVPQVASCHHERFDGSGYPLGLAGADLPLGSRIMALADVFDALTSRRDYPKYTDTENLGMEPMDLNRVVGILQKGSGNHFDPEVVTVFIRCLPKILIMYQGTHFPQHYVSPFLREYALPFLDGRSLEAD